MGEDWIPRLAVAVLLLFALSMHSQTIAEEGMRLEKGKDRKLSDRVMSAAIGAVLYLIPLAAFVICKH